MLVWMVVRLHRRVRPIDQHRFTDGAPLGAPLAVFVPAWQEAAVIGHMVGHALRAWPQQGLRIYVGCYGNDPVTVSAVTAAAAGDPRLRVVIHERPGPTTKADCLNRVYRAMCQDEARAGFRFRGVVMHDAEQVVSVVRRCFSQKTAVCVRIQEIKKAA